MRRQVVVVAVAVARTRIEAVQAVVKTVCVDARSTGATSLLSVPLVCADVCLS